MSQPPSQIDDIWVIYCRNCEEEREAEKVEYDFRCKTCDKVWDAESVTAYNPFIVEHYRQLFRGAKIAGMIPDPEFEGDREQQHRERLEW